MDVMDLYTMILQTECIMSIKKLLDYFKIKKIGNIKAETIIRLCQFVIQNNYFSYNGKFFHQVRGGAIAQVGHSTNFLDLYIENNNGDLFTKVYHKPSYEPYYLPFNSIHSIHMKMNIPYAMLIRAIKYCSTFETYLNEREKLRMTLLLNKYPGEFIEKQFSRVFQIHILMRPLSTSNYKTLREKLIDLDKKEKNSN
ncbi:unnamed protein product [Rotaria sp. Silwood1]|nr:unnamed protein product [Rotaria sp. Silwood1]CAF1691818.1 unnamed protein product [Rotaria sp. Silwood1]CAF3850261.1 unnamed protein product [Rotaria sp. Silwood1]CAF4875247.1 unnamed protein product [Rotaria sp. Silwood1]